MMRKARLVGALLGVVTLWMMIPGRSAANAPDQNWNTVCDTAALSAARTIGVPENVLLAITRTETARYGTPWPWTVNMEGDGHWFDSREAALTFVDGQTARGATSFDVGCFQINFRWHGEHFNSISAMFEPLENARYAARFLTELYQELGSWDAAVGAYHSRTERYAARYLRIYHGHLERLGGQPDMPPPQVAATAQPENRFPLLQEGGATALGSLVPSNAGSGQSLFAGRP